MQRRTAKPGDAEKTAADDTPIEDIPLDETRAIDDSGLRDADNPVDDTPDYIDDTLDDQLDEEHLKRPDSSDTDEPPNYIEGNDPEDALAKRDPDGPMLDHQDPDSGVKEIRQPENPDAHSPE